MFRISLFALGCAALVGCGTTDSGGDTKGGGGGGGGGTAFDAKATWSPTEVVVTISNGTDSGGYDFGMAETGATANGWGGEDCLGSVPSGYTNVNDAGYEYCHHLNQTGGSLTTGADPAAVVEGASTVFIDSLEENITYVLFESSSDACWSWGNDTGYYGAYMCTDL